jgi:hypothetical protein
VDTAVFHPIKAIMKETKELTMTMGNGVGSVEGVQPRVMFDVWEWSRKPWVKPMGVVKLAMAKKAWFA